MQKDRRAAPWYDHGFGRRKQGRTVYDPPAACSKRKKGVGMVKKFLLTDDDKDDRELFSEALASIDPGIICHGAEHGRDALRILNSLDGSKPDIIFIDINMPVMNGWELLHTLKT